MVCTFNGEKFVEEQLVSILNQSVRPKEIIISDDGSLDKTCILIELLFEQYEFYNYRIIHGPQNGLEHNFLSALKYTSCDWVFLSDQDDIWFKDKVLLMLENNFSIKTPCLIYSDAILIDEYGNKTYNSFIKYQGLDKRVLLDDSIFFRNCIQGASLCINIELKNLIVKNYSIKNTNIVIHDWWIALFARYFGEIIFINKSLFGYRQHSNNQIGAKNRIVSILQILQNRDEYFSMIIKLKKQKICFTKIYSKYNNKPIRNKYKYIGLIKKILVLLKL